MKQIIRIVLSIAVITLSAQIEIDIPLSESGIPFSLQSLTIFVVAAFLTPKQFTIALLGYILLGIAGLGVFAMGSSGIERLIGNSGGFLYGFLPAGLFISFCFKSRTDPAFTGILNSTLQATMVLFFFGIMHLAILHGFERAIDYGLKPFWKMALIKLILASVIIWFLKYFIAKRLNDPVFMD